ncbi:MAG: D-alanyl-D-alanine carboxypeptidase, partial [Muribaculaceae bacterium]|nr:D-alanyl-D-alanine carboxypeptidase [Muribaculaceae bacterium]
LGVNAAGVRIVDGSGLARLDRVTPRFMTETLVKMASSKNSSTYLSFFPKVGKEGTVASLLSNSALKGQLALKSGSINGVHCYVGYKLTSDGQPTHTVVIIVNNFFSSRQAVRTAIESFLEHFDWK